MGGGFYPEPDLSLISLTAQSWNPAPKACRVMTCTPDYLANAKPPRQQHTLCLGQTSKQPTRCSCKAQTQMGLKVLRFEDGNIVILMSAAYLHLGLRRWLRCVLGNLTPP